MGRKEAIIRLRQVLVRRREALRRALSGDLSLLQEMREQSSGDLIDFAMDSAQDELSSQLAEVESRELEQIEKALERMHKGVYGICEVTGRPIPLARLQAIPYATLCIEAQRELERLGGSANNPDDYARLEDHEWEPVEAAEDEAEEFDDLEMDVT